MGYKSWFDNHAKKHKKIVDKLLQRGFGKDEVIEYFEFDNMIKNEPDFCPLYKDNKKCHEMDDLNCYMCACPNFRFNDNGLDGDFLSKCFVGNGDIIKTKSGKIHQDCSSCSVPHHKRFIEKNFSFDWKEMMKGCLVGG